MNSVDFIFIRHSGGVGGEDYSRLPLDRIALYRDRVFPGMIYYKNAFRSRFDILNFFASGIFFEDANYRQRRTLLNIWNLPGFSSLHLPHYLWGYGFTTKVINNFDAQWDIFCQAYEDCNIPPLVGISTTFYMSYAEVKRIAEKIRSAYPYAEIVLGGAFVNSQTINGDLNSFEDHMRRCGIRYVLYAFNSETDLKDLLLFRKDKIDINRIHNIAYIEGGDFTAGEFKLTSSKWNNPVLTKTLDLPKHFDSSFIHHTVQVRTSYGCPFSCAFCSYPSIARSFSCLSCDDVVNLLSDALKIPGVTNIIFTDDTLNISLKRFKDICRRFLRYRFKWFAYLRAQFLDEEVCKLMRDSGCRGVFLGIESANEAVLKNMNKKTKPAQFARSLHLLKKYGIPSVAAFIIGFPGETEGSIKEDIAFIESSAPDFYAVQEFYFIRHTPAYQKKDKFGLSGLGNCWSHKTMGYDLANEWKMKMFMDIKNSIFVDPGMDLWYIAYLYDQGYRIEDIMILQKEMNMVIRDQMGGSFDDNHPSFKRLRILLADKMVNNPSEDSVS
jgi:anaerobic magnesium-protoporphyrin IX monomethyl ester cyclase